MIHWKRGAIKEMTDDEKILLEEYRAKKNRKKNYSKYIVTFIIIMNVMFTIAILYVFNHTGNEPSALISAFFAFTTVELWSLAGIKKKKIERRDE